MTAVVVGVALIDRGGAEPRALVAQRNRPPALAGLWEFPGGKVEVGEADEEALRRECREELGVDVDLGGRLGADTPLPSGAVLRVWTATVGSGKPAARDHAALRWVTGEEAEDLPWIPADRPLVAELRRLLADPR